MRGDWPPADQGIVAVRGDKRRKVVVAWREVPPEMEKSDGGRLKRVKEDLNLEDPWVSGLGSQMSMDHPMNYFAPALPPSIWLFLILGCPVPVSPGPQLVAALALTVKLDIGSRKWWLRTYQDFWRTSLLLGSFS